MIDPEKEKNNGTLIRQNSFNERCTGGYRGINFHRVHRDNSLPYVQRYANGEPREKKEK